MIPENLARSRATHPRRLAAAILGLVMALPASHGSASLNSRRPTAPWKNYSHAEAVLLLKLDVPYENPSRSMAELPGSVVRSWKGPAAGTALRVSARHAAPPTGSVGPYRHALVLGALPDGKTVQAGSRAVLLVPDDSVSAVVAYVDERARVEAEPDAGVRSDRFFEAMLAHAGSDDLVIGQLVDWDLTSSGQSPWGATSRLPAEPFVTRALERQGQSWRLAYVVAAQVRKSESPTPESVAQLARLFDLDRDYARIRLRQPRLAAPLLVHEPIRDVVKKIAADQSDPQLAAAAAAALAAAPAP